MIISHYQEIRRLNRLIKTVIVCYPRNERTLK